MYQWNNHRIFICHMYPWDNNGLIMFNIFFGENMIMGCNDDMTFNIFGDHLLCGMEHGHSNMLHQGYIKTYSILIAKKRGVDATFLGRYLPNRGGSNSPLLASPNANSKSSGITWVNGGWWYVEYYQWIYIYIFVYRRTIIYVWLYLIYIYIYKILKKHIYNCKECWYPKLDPNERCFFLHQLSKLFLVGILFIAVLCKSMQRTLLTHEKINTPCPKLT